MTMFDRWTERARQVVVLAQEESRTLKHNYIGTEHILLGLLREERGLAARVLEHFDVTIEKVRSDVVRIVGGPGESPEPVGQIPFTPRARKVMDLALREALANAHNYVGTEHILLGLLREGAGVAARILLDCDLKPDTIRNEVLRMLTGPAHDNDEPVEREFVIAPASATHKVRATSEAEALQAFLSRQAALGRPTDVVEWIVFQPITLGRKLRGRRATDYETTDLGEF